jgi:hypothetical protein
MSANPGKRCAFRSIAGVAAPEDGRTPPDNVRIAGTRIAPVLTINPALDLLAATQHPSPHIFMESR